MVAIRSVGHAGAVVLLVEVARGDRAALGDLDLVRSFGRARHRRDHQLEDAGGVAGLDGLEFARPARLAARA